MLDHQPNISRLGHCQSVKMLDRPEMISVEVLLELLYLLLELLYLMLRRPVYEKLVVFLR